MNTKSTKHINYSSSREGDLWCFWFDPYFKYAAEVLFMIIIIGDYFFSFSLSENLFVGLFLIVMWTLGFGYFVIHVLIRRRIKFVFDRDKLSISKLFNNRLWTSYENEEIKYLVWRHEISRDGAAISHFDTLFLKLNSGKEIELFQLFTCVDGRGVAISLNELTQKRVSEICDWINVEYVYDNKAR